MLVCGRCKLIGEWIIPVFGMKNGRELFVTLELFD